MRSISATSEFMQGQGAQLRSGVGRCSREKMNDKPKFSRLASLPGQSKKFLRGKADWEQATGSTMFLDSAKQTSYHCVFCASVRLSFCGIQI